MLARVASEALSGLDSSAISIEADVAAAAPAFTIVGLPDAAVQESRERVRAAIVNSGYQFPARRLTVNLAPAHLRKEGPAFDLPIALAFLAATGQASACPADTAVLGELGLDGSVRPVAGVLAIAQSARQRGVARLLVPAANASEAGLVSGLSVLAAGDLREAVSLAAGKNGGETPHAGAATDLQAALVAQPDHDDLDLADVIGQEHAKRALEVAVAGSHNVLMVGPPGSGKTMLARRLPAIMPPLSLAEAIDVSRVYSVAGLLSGERPLVTRRPFRAPHHTISAPGLVGGGASPRPGEVSLAHNGVLFLDEFPEFRLSALEGLRQPLEDGEVTVSRSLHSVTFPARLMLVAAMNPCPCGFAGDRQHACSCPAHRLRQYGARISGPLLDRIDVRVAVGRVPPRARRDRARAESSSAVRGRVAAARVRQGERLAGTAQVANAHLSTRQVRRLCTLEPAAVSMLDRAYDKLKLSARACERVVKVARTIADLAGADTIGAPHVAEALGYRTADGVRR